MKTFAIAMCALVGFLVTTAPAHAQRKFDVPPHQPAGWSGQSGAPKKDKNSPNPKDKDKDKDKDKESAKKKERKKTSDDWKKRCDDKTKEINEYEKEKQKPENQGVYYTPGKYYDRNVGRYFPDTSYQKLKDELAQLEKMYTAAKNLYDYEK